MLKQSFYMTILIKASHNPELDYGKCVSGFILFY